MGKDNQVENKIEEIKVEKIEEDKKNEKIEEDKQIENKLEESKSERIYEDKHDFEEQEQTIKDVQQEESSKLSTITQEPSIDTKVTAETVSSSVDGIDSTTTTTERREIITDEDGNVQERVFVEKVTKQEVTVPSDDVQAFEVAKDILIDGQLQDQTGTTISE